MKRYTFLFGWYVLHLVLYSFLNLLNVCLHSATLEGYLEYLCLILINIWIRKKFN